MQCGLQGILLKFVAPELENLKITVKAAMTSPAVCMKCTDQALKGFEVTLSLQNPTR